MIKRLLLIFGLILPTIVLSTPQFVSAVDVIDPVCSRENSTVSNSTVCKEKETGGENPLVGQNGVITKAIQILAFVVGVAAVFSMVIGGFRMITSGGDASRAASARSGIIFALVGIVVAAAAQIIVSFVLSRL